MREKLEIRSKGTITKGEFTYKLDDKGHILMNAKPYTEAKIKLLRKYYRKAIEIFARTSYRNFMKHRRGHSFVVDAFCGSGIYDDGTIGTPLMLIEAFHEVIQKYPQFRNHIIFFFNDHDPDMINALKNRIESDSVWKDYQDCIEFTNNDFTYFSNQLGSLVDKKGKNGHISLLLDPYGFSIVTPSLIRDIIDLGFSEVVVLWMIQSITKFLHLDDHPATKYLRNILQPGSVEIINSQINNEGKIHKAIELFQQTIRAQNIAQYCTSFSFKRDERTWYAFFNISNHYKAKEVFDQARSQIAGMSQIYEPKKNYAQTSFGDDILDVKQVDELNYLKEVKNAIGNIPSVFVKKGLVVMTIEEIKQGYASLYPNNYTSVGIPGFRMKWVHEIIPKAVDKFDELSYESYGNKLRKITRIRFQK